MTKRTLLMYLEDYDDCDDVGDLLHEIEREREYLIEELEERQHMSGFYEFQDMMEMRRRER